MPLAVKTFDQLRDAASALGTDAGARFLGGGTLLMRDINEGDISITTLVRSTDRAFTEIRSSGSRITLGAGVTMSEVAAHPELQYLKPVARTVGGPAIRNMATIGGNLFAFSPYGDFTVAMLALEATVAVQGGYSSRDVPLEEFLATRDRDSKSLVTGVTFRQPDNPTAFHYSKVSRTHPKGASVLSIAAHLPASGNRVSSPRIAYGAMAPTPIRAKAAENALNGKSLDEAGIADALAAATQGCSPASDSIASAWYRNEVLPVYLKRLLLGAPN